MKSVIIIPHGKTEEEQAQAALFAFQEFLKDDEPLKIERPKQYRIEDEPPDSYIAGYVRVSEEMLRPIDGFSDDELIDDLVQMVKTEDAEFEVIEPKRLDNPA